MRAFVFAFDSPVKQHLAKLLQRAREAEPRRDIHKSRIQNQNLNDWRIKNQVKNEKDKRPIGGRQSDFQCLLTPTVFFETSLNIP